MARTVRGTAVLARISPTLPLSHATVRTIIIIIIILCVSCVLHDLQGLVVVCGVKCATEVDVKAVDVLLGEACIFQSMVDVMALSVGVLLFSESLL